MAEWINIEGYTGVEAFGFKETTIVGIKCSACGFEADVSDSWVSVCPNCGAKMEGNSMYYVVELTINKDDAVCILEVFRSYEEALEYAQDFINKIRDKSVVLVIRSCETFNNTYVPA